MKSIRLSFLGATAASALACLSHAAPAAFAAQESSTEPATETVACECTCAVCVAKHGAKATQAAQTPAPEAPKAKALPDLGVDIEAEVARVLATELEAVDFLLTDVTNAVEAEEAAAEGKMIVVYTGAAPAGAGTPDERGYMGISLNMDPDAGGAIVGTVTPGSPAAKAGLQPGDVITAAEEMPVESADELIAVLIDLKVGDTATIEFERGGEERKVSLTLASRATLDGASGQGVILARPVEGVEHAENIVVDLSDVDFGEPVIMDVEIDDEDVVLPEISPKLRGLGYVGDGGVAIIEDIEVIEEVEEARAPRRMRARVRLDREEHAVDPLPEGYVEIETRRERRPASDAALRERVRQLEKEVDELARIVDQLRAELDRRNPR